MLIIWAMGKLCQAQPEMKMYQTTQFFHFVSSQLCCVVIISHMNLLQSTRLIIVVLCIFQSRIDGVTRTDDDVKDQELQIKIQENERLQREVNNDKN